MKETAKKETADRKETGKREPGEMKETGKRESTGIKEPEKTESTGIMDRGRKNSILPAAKAVLVFFGVAFCGTVISRFTSSVLTPVVETESVSSGTIDHNILADAMVSGDRKVPVYVCPGIMVEEVYVSEGGTVEKSDKLLRVNTGRLMEAYLDKKIERKGMKLSGWYASEDERQADELRIAAADEELATLEMLVEQEGIVYAPFGGMVSEVRQKTGSISTEEAALILTQEADTYKLRVSITEEQKEHTTAGDKATVQTGETPVSAEVTAVYEETGNPQHYIAEVQVPGETFRIGDSVLVDILHTSGKYDFIVPLSALRSDAAGSYVLVAREKETFLGTELVASKIQIKVGDTDTEYAGVASDALSADDRVIISADKQIEAGDTVREK